jgi:hypothetical protein
MRTQVLWRSCAVPVAQSHLKADAQQQHHWCISDVTCRHKRGINVLGVALCVVSGAGMEGGTAQEVGPLTA